MHSTSPARRALAGRATVLIAALAICAYGAVLRLNALTDRYGTLEHPAWARVLTTQVAPLARYVEPGPYAWPPVAVPYVGGDPASYLKFARQMRSFYQGHVREPVFLAITRGWLWLLDNRDIGISFASASMSTLAIFATFLLGRAAGSPGVGLVAALALAVDYDAVSWAPEGWRDDTFTVFVILGAWTLVRLRERPTALRAIAAGAIGAAACLTRITSLSWVLPGLAMLCLPPRDETWQPRARAAAIAVVVTAVLVAPYLINCARVFGDPLISIDVHTGYYRAGEGIGVDRPMSAAAYIGGKLMRQPIAELDTALTGIFVIPMRNKFGGFEFWLPHLSEILRALAALGLVIWVASATGRLLLVVCLASLVPYAFTWNIADGQAWRFTMHVYPLYLVAGFTAVQQIWRAGMSARRAEWRPLRRQAVLVAGALGVILLAARGYRVLPYYVAREAVAGGNQMTISAGDRDEVFFTRGWSPALAEGNVTSRLVLGGRAWLELPLPAGRGYHLRVRLDPVRPDAPRALTILVAGRIVGRFGLTFDPERVGSYEVDVPPDVARGATTMQIVADGTVAADSCGPRCAALPPAARVSLRVWYIRISPV